MKAVRIHAFGGPEVLEIDDTFVDIFVRPNAAELTVPGRAATCAAEWR